MALEKYEMKLQTDNVHPVVLHGTIAPNATPQKVGDVYIKTDTGAVYMSKGTASANDWVLAYTNNIQPGVTSAAEPPGAAPTKVGDIYVDTNTSILYVANGTATVANWIPQAKLDTNWELDTNWMMGRTKSFLYDDFFSYTSAQQWTSRTATGTVAIDATTGANGWLKLTSGSVAAQYAGITATSAVFPTKPLGGRAVCRFKLNETANFKFVFGITTGTALFGAAATNSVYMELSTDNADPTKWYMVTNTAGSVVRAVTSITHVPASCHTIELKWSDDGTGVEGIVDGVKTASMGDLPSANGSLGVNMSNLGGVASRYAYIDSLAYTGPRVA